MSTRSPENWANKFAELLEEFVWLEAGGEQSPSDRNALFRDAVNALNQYGARTSKLKLKEAIRLAVQNAPLDSDPWKAALQIIATRACDWEQHASEDGSVSEDIAAWLNFEAVQ